jgi:hypothetical protein
MLVIIGNGTPIRSPSARALRRELPMVASSDKATMPKSVFLVKHNIVADSLLNFGSKAHRGLI